MNANEIEARLNEYETLKKATERLSAEDAKRAILYARSHYRILDESDTIGNLQAYADTLERKND